MPNASGIQVQLSYIAEVTQGTTPGTPTMKLLRTISRDINPAKTVLESEETNADRNIRSIRHGFESVTGQFTAELAPVDYDDILEAALGGSWTTNVLKVGTANKTFTFEKRYPDITQYQAFRGVAINELTIAIQPDAIVSLSASVVGMSFAAMSGTSLGSPTAPTGDEPFTSFSGAVLEDGDAIGIVTGITFTVNNNKSVTPVVGSKNAPDVQQGMSSVSGTVTVHLADASLFNKFQAETITSLSVEITQGTKGLTFLFPKVKYTAGNINPPASGPVILELPFVAYYDSVTGTSLQITRDNT